MADHTIELCVTGTMDRATLPQMVFIQVATASCHNYCDKLSPLVASTKIGSLEHS